MKHVISGLIVALLGIWGIIVWWNEFGQVMRGVVPLLLLLGGVVAIMAGLQCQDDEDAEETSKSDDKDAEENA